MPHGENMSEESDYIDMSRYVYFILLTKFYKD